MTRDGLASRSLLVIGRSGRALAASACRAGYCCDVIDEFGDDDTRRLGRYVRCTADSLSRADLQPLLEEWQRVSGKDKAVILPGSGFEGQPELLNWLRDFGMVAANRAAAVSAVKAPARFFPLLDSLDIRHPPVIYQPSGVKRDAINGTWLVKAEGGEGGIGIRPWNPEEAIPEGCYLQQKGMGRSLSAVFLADGSSATVLGFNECFNVAETTGEPADYRFATIVRTPLPAALAEEIASSIDTLVSATGLRGLCGMDMLWDEDGISVLEINPRPPASFELHEDNINLVAAHLDACAGNLPDRLRPAEAAAGKRIVYAPGAVHIAADADWPAWTADRPAAGSRLAAGAPICTVFARAATPEACQQILQQRHDSLLRNIKKTIQHTEINKVKYRKEVTA